MTSHESPAADADRAPVQTLAKVSETTVRVLGHSEVRRAAREAGEACNARRARVLAHPDLAARLTQPPLRHSRPELWNGYVPPARGPYGAKYPDDHGRGHGVDEALNTSPGRAALMDILQAVLEREQEAVSDAA